MEILYAFLMVIYSLQTITRDVIASTLDQIQGEILSSPDDVESSQLRRDEELGNELLRRTLRSAFLKVHARLAEKRRRDILDYLYKRKTKISRATRALAEDVNYQLIMPHIHQQQRHHKIVSNHTIQPIARSSIIHNHVKSIDSQASSLSSSSSLYKNITSPVFLLNTTLAKRDITKQYKYDIAANETSPYSTSCCNEGYEGKCCPKNNFGRVVTSEQQLPSFYDGCCGDGLEAICCPNQNTIQKVQKGNFPSCCDKAIVNTCCAEHKPIGTTASRQRRNRRKNSRLSAENMSVKNISSSLGDGNCVSDPHGKSSNCFGNTTREASNFDEKTSHETPCSVLARKLYDLPYATEYPLCNERNQILITPSYKKRYAGITFPTQSRVNAKPINKPSTDSKVVISPRPPLAPPLLGTKKKGSTFQYKSTKKQHKEDLRYRLKVRAVNSNNNKPKKHIKIKYKNRVIRLKLVKKNEKGRRKPTKNKITFKIKKNKDGQTTSLVRVKREFDGQSENGSSSKLGPISSQNLNNNSTDVKNETVKSKKRNPPLFNINAHDSDLITALTLRDKINNKSIGMRKKSMSKKHAKYFRPMRTTKSAHARRHHIHRSRRGRDNIKLKGKTKAKKIVVTVSRQKNEIFFKK